MSSKDPAFLFYSSDFLTGTMFLTDEQVGKVYKAIMSTTSKRSSEEKRYVKDM